MCSAMADVACPFVVVCSLSLVPNVLAVSPTYFSLQSSHERLCVPVLIMEVTMTMISYLLPIGYWVRLQGRRTIGKSAFPK